VIFTEKRHGASLPSAENLAKRNSSKKVTAGLCLELTTPRMGGLAIE
jgi:hypothetical protein